MKQFTSPIPEFAPDVQNNSAIFIRFAFRTEEEMGTVDVQKNASRSSTPSVGPMTRFTIVNANFRSVPAKRGNSLRWRIGAVVVRISFSDFHFYFRNFIFSPSLSEFHFQNFIFSIRSKQIWYQEYITVNLNPGKYSILNLNPGKYSIVKLIIVLYFTIM